MLLCTSHQHCPWPMGCVSPSTHLGWDLSEIHPHQGLNACLGLTVWVQVVSGLDPLLAAPAQCSTMGG